MRMRRMRTITINSDGKGERGEGRGDRFRVGFEESVVATEVRWDYNNPEWGQIKA